MLRSIKSFGIFKLLLNWIDSLMNRHLNRFSIYPNTLSIIHLSFSSGTNRWDRTNGRARSPWTPRTTRWTGSAWICGQRGSEGANKSTLQQFHPKYTSIYPVIYWSEVVYLISVHREIQVQQGQRVKTDLQDSEGSPAREVYRALWWASGMKHAIWTNPYSSVLNFV